AFGNGSVFAIDIFTEHVNWKSRGHGRVQFDSPKFKAEALSLSEERKLVFKGHYLCVSHSFEDIITRPVDPENRLENAAGLCLLAGIMLKGDCMGILESWNGCKLWVLPERKKLLLFLDNEEESYKLEIQYGDICETHLCCSNGDGDEINAILLKLKHAPKVFRKISGPDVTSKFASDRYNICIQDMDFIWVRTTDFSEKKSIGYSSALCLNIPKGLNSPKLCTSLPYMSKDLIKLSLQEMNLNHLRDSLVPVFANNSGFEIAYEVLFQVHSLVHTQKIGFVSAFDSELFGILSRLDVDTALLVLKEMHKLPSTCYNPKEWITEVGLLSVESRRSKKNVSVSSSMKNGLKDQNVMSCHRILVTPLRIYCLGPELEASNYVIKNFASYGSDFVRVTFVDEDWGRLPAASISTTTKQGIFAKPYKTDIYYRILSVLRDGIAIGEKKFEFLAFSASQLRSNSVWMFASNDSIKSVDIRDWMGCFNSIRSISKCAARMGQLFSSSRQTIEVSPGETELIPDVECFSDGVKYCFSDGIGKISSSFAQEISSMLGLSHVPSAFQIRYGGYKGIVVVNRHSRYKLALRSSMLKFESNNRMLNVTKWSESQPCYLNREIIVLLSTLGVKDAALLEMQQRQLEFLGSVLVDSQAAMSVLESSGMGESKSILPRMLSLGYKPTEEPYLHMMLRSYLENQIADLRTRCRVFVPKGRVLLGVLDEFGRLEYGQVYVRVTMNKSEVGEKQPYFRSVDGNSSVVVGKVVITKNPCLHPGDVRVLEAVCDPELVSENLVDCLVFPQKGHRPHPNECSGGDLDGDLYFVSWDTDLVPPRTVDPMDYTGRRPRIMDHDVTIQEIQRFFADYMVSDTLGAISNAHLVHADREPEKALSSKCLELAALHSTAVDYAKSGAPAAMPRALLPREYPDFMERVGKPTYPSTGPLGKLYRAALRFIGQRNSANEIPSRGFFDGDLVADGHEAFLETALSHRERYSERMGQLLSYYGAEDEAEILTGNIESKSSYLSRDNRRYGEVKDRILVSVKSLMKEAKVWFGDGLSSEKEGDDRKLASAWYVVTYHPRYGVGRRNCSGFPWAVGSVLMDIKAAKN
ncbi:hypothetical protein M569_08951, partial [Genlisea aurea]